MKGAFAAVAVRKIILAAVLAGGVQSGGDGAPAVPARVPVSEQKEGPAVMATALALELSDGRVRRHAAAEIPRGVLVFGAGGPVSLGVQSIIQAVGGGGEVAAGPAAGAGSFARIGGIGENAAYFEEQDGARGGIEIR
jgi:hypothetical protein